MKLALVVRFMGKEEKGESLNRCMEGGWKKVLGHICIFDMLARSWICFEEWKGCRG